MSIDRIYTWSTFEDAIPEDEKDWEQVGNSMEMYKCKKHNTLFNREEEPCWQCYNPYE